MTWCANRVSRHIRRRLSIPSPNLKYVSAQFCAYEQVRVHERVLSYCTVVWCPFPAHCVLTSENRRRGRGCAEELLIDPEWSRKAAPRGCPLHGTTNVTINGCCSAEDSQGYQRGLHLRAGKLNRLGCYSPADYTAGAPGASLDARDLGGSSLGLACCYLSRGEGVLVVWPLDDWRGQGEGGEGKHRDLLESHLACVLVVLDGGSRERLARFDGHGIHWKWLRSVAGITDNVECLKSCSYHPSCEYVDEPFISNNTTLANKYYPSSVELIHINSSAPRWEDTQNNRRCRPHVPSVYGRCRPN